MNSEYLPYLVFGVFGAFALVLVALVWAINRSRAQLAEERRRTDHLQQDLKCEEQRSRTLKDTVDRLTTLESKQNAWNSASASRPAPAPLSRRMSSTVTELPSRSSFHHSTPVSSPPADNTLANAMLFSHLASPLRSPASAPDECRTSCCSPSSASSYSSDSSSSSDSGSCSSGSFD